MLQYLLGAALGFLAGPLVAGALWMIVLFYANWLGDFDTKNDRFSEIVAASVLIAPVVGMLAGVGFVAWRRRRVRTGRRR